MSTERLDHLYGIVAMIVAAACVTLLVMKPKKEVAPTACSVQLEETQAVADFWREQALALRTDGVDSLRPVPETQPPIRNDL